MSEVQTLSKESAQKELEKFYDYYEIETEDFEKVDGDDEESQANKAIQRMQAKILKGLMKGRISFDESDGGFAIILHKKIGDPLKFNELDGHAKAEMSKKKQTDEYGRIFALTGKMCGLGEHAVKKLKGPELSLVEAIGTTLLMG